MSAKISHSGIVASINKGCVQVRILQTSACAACKVAGHCNASESKEKIVDVLNVNDISTLKVGDHVIVTASHDVVLVTVLLIMLKVFSNEGLAAITALLSLIPYYWVLYLMRDKIQKKMSFFIERNN